MKKLPRILALAALQAISTGSQAETYEISLSASTEYTSASNSLQLPIEFNRGKTEILATFHIDEASKVEIGNFDCAPGTSTRCGAYGYTVLELHVTINGNAHDEWIAGTNSNSFFNGSIDLKNRLFYTPGSPSSIANGWLPLISKDYPGASLNFGQMYISLGGVGFTSFGFSAKDANGNIASGWSSASSTKISAVPEPSAVALFIAALIPIQFMRVRRGLT